MALTEVPLSHRVSGFFRANFTSEQEGPSPLKCSWLHPLVLWCCSKPSLILMELNQLCLVSVVFTRHFYRHNWCLSPRMNRWMPWLWYASFQLICEKIGFSSWPFLNKWPRRGGTTLVHCFFVRESVRDSLSIAAIGIAVILYGLLVLLDSL